jgi:hypothetical protein
MSARTTIAIDFVRRRLRGVEATMHRGSIHIDRALSVAMPDDIDIDDDQMVGTWIGRTLSRHKLDASRAVVAVNREHAVVRTLLLPTDELDEVPEMVNLAMKRDLPIDADDAVIDFIVLGTSDGNTEVMACAVPCRIVDRVREVTSVAGVTASRISLRCFGTAALVNSLRDYRGRSVLAIDLGEDGFEFVVSRDGRIGFTRGVEIRPSADGIDETIVTEVRRSWISHRLSEREEEEVTTGVLFAPTSLGDRLAGWIGEATGIDITTIRNHPRVRVPEDFPGDAWPLAGMLLRDGLREPTIDFGSPRKAPDLAARKRRGVLITVGLLLLSGLLGWTIGNLQMNRERAVNADLEAKARNALVEYHRNRRDVLRLEHLESWLQAEPDWMSQLVAFREFAPDPETVVLDSFTGSFLVEPVRYDAAGKFFSVGSEVRLQLSGEARDRDIANALRESIVDSERFLLRSTGAESLGGDRLPVPFSFQLRSTDSGSDPEGGGS